MAFTSPTPFARKYAPARHTSQCPALRRHAVCLHSITPIVRAAQPLPSRQTESITLPEDLEKTPIVRQIPHHPDWLYAGPCLSEGSRPAIVYLALTASQSLQLDPFNQYVTNIHRHMPQVRIFAPTLPLHSENVIENEHVFHKWRKIFGDAGDIVTPFVRKAAVTLDTLTKAGFISQQQVHIAGLSRGGLLAGLLAAQLTQATSVSSVVLFAPVTSLSTLSEFSNSSDFTSRALEKIHRSSLYRPDVIRKLVSVPVNVYVGNVDTRVDTRSVVDFAHHLATHAATSGVRSPPHTLIMYPRCVISISHLYLTDLST